MSQRLNEAYTWVRQNLFPEWDSDGVWEIKEGYGPVYYTQPSWELYEGECDRGVTPFFVPTVMRDLVLGFHFHCMV